MDPQEPASLDPIDWTEFRAAAHGILDTILTHIQTLRDQPVWRPPTPEVLAKFSEPLPHQPKALVDVLADVRDFVVPYATGNLHPAFMGWVHGAGTPVGLLGELVAAGLNLNCGGRNHVGIEIERQVVSWMRDALGYPGGASGIFVTGSSMANFLSTIIAKTNALGQSSRVQGLRNAPQDVVAYASAEAHSCIAQAMELSGIGSANLRPIPVDDAARLRVDELKRAISQDRKSGRLPFLIVGTAGTVNTGAIDPLDELAFLASAERMWFHVDGAIGALAMFSDELKRAFRGIERSDSVALDFHKWGHVPYDAGFLLVRDGEAHKRAFAQPAAYLQRADRGLAAGETWPCDLGPDLSRGCRALKTWMTIAVLGTDSIGKSIEHTCTLARYLAECIEQSEHFVLKAPVALNIVCFGIQGAGTETVRKVVIELQESGIAAPSWTTLNGELVVRCAVVNHRTTSADIDRFVTAITALTASASENTT